MSRDTPNSTILEQMLSQKEQELQQINQLRIKNLDDIIGQKMRIINSLERQDTS
jgi:flagellar biosynthesis/type III secretory pathway chaperone